jgi:hypothetical protein
MESKFCPQLGGSCLGGNCAWFNGTTEQCDPTGLYLILSYVAGIKFVK